MKGYFLNPELKKSSGILLLLITLFLFITSFSLKMIYNNLKVDYINSLGAISSRLIEKDPQLEKEIIPLITKGISKEEAIKGKALLNQYGLTENLENELFPSINTIVKNSNYSIILIFLSMAIVLFTLNYFQYIIFYKKIRRLTIGAKKVVDGEYDIAINENKEGDFSKLANSFNSMKEIIRNNLNDLRKEKQFLVNLLSDISHQLKTPLSSMIVYNDIMLNKELSKEQRETFLLNNQNQLNRMNWLIKSLLKLAKLDAKAISLNKETQSLNESIQNSIDTLESKAIEKNITIVFQEKEDISFNHDRLWIEEAFINILKNGIEHTPNGCKISVSLTENPLYKRITIQDSGEGIREEDIPNIFKRFYKAKSSKKSDSVGIGLALAKSIIESHDGIIEAQSKVNEGTTFIITFIKY